MRESILQSPSTHIYCPIWERVNNWVALTGRDRGNVDAARYEERNQVQTNRVVDIYEIMAVLITPQFIH